MNFICKLEESGEPETVRVYLSLYLHHLEKNLEKTESLEDLLKIWVEEEKLSKSTIQKLVVIYNSWYKWKYGKIPEKSPRIIKKINRLEMAEPVEIWNPEESKKALQVAFYFNKPLYDKLYFTLSTGVRTGELWGIIWEDIDFIKGRIKIKGYKSAKVRFVPMSGDLQKMLSSRYVVGIDPKGPVFEKSTLNGPLARLCRMAGVKRLTWHGLRHTFATTLLDAEVSPRKVSKLLGHNKVSTTINMYWGDVDGEPDLSALPKGI